MAIAELRADLTRLLDDKALSDVLKIMWASLENKQHPVFFGSGLCSP